MGSLQRQVAFFIYCGVPGSPCLSKTGQMLARDSIYDEQDGTWAGPETILDSYHRKLQNSVPVMVSKLCV